MDEKIETATELEFLKWFYCYTDFGPSDGDVRDSMKLDFINAKKKYIPEGYNLFDDGKTDANFIMSRAIEDSL